MLKKITKKVLPLLLGLALLGPLFFLSGKAGASNPATISFQGKVVNSDGTNVPDGTYSFVFRIYNTSSPTMTTSCTSTSSCLWEETQGSVSVTSGIFQVELGSSCALTSGSCNNTAGGPINFANDSSLYLTMQFNGDVSGANGGFMSPLIHITSVPFALQADNASTLGGISSSGFIQNQTASLQAANFNIQSSASGSIAAAITGASGQTVDILDVDTNGNANPVLGVNSTGSATFRAASNSTTAFQIQNTSGASGALLTADTTNMRLGVNVTYAAMSAPSGLTSTASAGTGFTAGQSYLYEVTAIDSLGGETTVSNEPTACAPASTNLQCTLAWTAVTGASGYRIYRTANGGLTHTEDYLTTVLTNSFIDKNAITLGSTLPPGSNTAYSSTNTATSLGQISVGGLGSPSGQVYVSGTLPKDITNGGVPTAGTNPAAIYAQGRYAYVLDLTGAKMQIFDVSNPAAPVDVSGGGVTTGSTPTSVKVQGHYAYVIDRGANKLQIFDVSNPAAPVDVTGGGVTTGSTPEAVYVQGRYAYVTDNGVNKLQIFDISNPAAPVDVTGGGVTAGSGPYGIYVQGRYAYVTDSVGNKLQIFDVSNPAAPVDVSSGGVATGASPEVVYVQGRYAYVTDNTGNKLQIFDVSNPAAPVDVTGGGVATAVSPWTVFVQGRYAYVVDFANKLQVFDVSNPAAPVDVSGGGVAVSGNAEGLYVQGRYAYVSAATVNKLQVFDLGGEYTQQLEAGGTETGTLQVDSNGQVNGDFNVQGGLDVGQSLQVSGNIGDTGGLNVQGGTVLGGGKNQLGAPTGLIANAATSGGSLSGVYKYEVTAIDSTGGETLVSNEVTTASLANPNQTEPLTWTAVTGATGYKVYRTAASGGSGTEKFLAFTATNSYSDTGAITLGTGTAPTTDTTGQLTVKGSALLKNSSNSTTAFQLQNSGGNNLLVGDTSNMRLGVDVTYAVMNTPTSPAASLPTQMTTPTVTPTGGSGAVTYKYIVTAVTATGNSAASVAGQTTTGVAFGSLSSAVYNNVSWSSFAGATSYNVYRTTGGTTTGLIANVTAPTVALHDTGLTANGIVPVAGGNLTANKTYFYKISAIDAGGGETGLSTEVSQLTATTANTQQTIDLTWTAPSPSTGVVGYRIYRTNGTLGSGNEDYLTTVSSNVFTDDGTLTLSSTAPPLSSTPAYTATNNSSNNLQIAVGGNGSNTGQVYVGGNVPASYVGLTNSGISNADFVVVQGNYAYVTDNSGNALFIFDVSNPANPVKVASTTSSLSSPTFISVQGHYAYIANAGGSLAIFDISNPAAPTLVSSTAADLATSQFLAVEGHYVYVTSTSGNRLSIFDVTNPAAPVEVGSTTSSLSSPTFVSVQGRYAYVSNNPANTVSIFDISNPAAPTLVSTATTGLNGPLGNTVSGRYLYVSNQTGGALVIFDISNPAAPVEVGSVSGAGTEVAFIQGRYAFVSTALSVVDISNPAKPVILGTMGALGGHDIYVQGRYAYVASTTSGLAVYDLGGTYTQQLEAGGTETGTLQVDTNGQVAGNFNIQGGLQVGSSVQINGSLGLNNGESVQGSSILGGGNNQLGPPSGTPTVTCTGTCNVGGAYTWSYKVTSINSSGGESTASVVGSISNPNSNTTLSGTNYNTISWSAVTGATGYRVYRTVSGGTPATVGFIGTTTGTSLADTGLAGSGLSAPTTDTTSQLTVLGSGLIKTTANSTTAFQVQNSSGQNVLVADTTNGQILLGNSGAGVNGTIVFNNSAGSGTAAITLAGNPSTNYTYQLPTGTVSSNQCLQSGTVSGGNVPLTFASCSGGSVYSTVDNAGTPLTQRNTLNFTGNSVSCVDNSGSSRTDCTVAPTLQNAYDNSSSPATITTSSASKNVVIQSGSTFNSPGAFQVQNSNGQNVLVADTTNGQILLGNSGAGVNGTIVFNNSSGSGTATITLAGNPSTNYTYQLPTGTVSSNQCLQSGTLSGNNVPLTFGSCGQSYTTVDNAGTPLTQRSTLNFNGNSVSCVDNSGSSRTDCTVAPTLQNAYDNSPGGTNPEFILNNGGTNTGGIDIQNNNGSPVTGSLFAVRNNALSGLGNIMFGIDNNGLISVQPAASLVNGQSEVTQTLTNGSSTGGTVNGYNQTITVNDTGSASTTNGINVAVTDATTLANTTNGLKATVTDNGASGGKTDSAVLAIANGTNTSQLQYALNAQANHGVAVIGASTGIGGSVTCGPTTAANSIGVCGSTSQASSAGFGGYFAATANSGTALFATNGTSTSNILVLQDGTTPTNVFTVADGGVATFSVPTSNSTAFVVQDSSSLAYFSVDTSGSQVTIGSATTDSTAILLQIDSYNGSFTPDTTPGSGPEASGNCSTTVNQGAIYFSTTSNAIRACINGGWEDLVSTAALGLQLFGVVPDSGTTPGDLIGIGTDTGPCKPFVGATTTTVAWNSCTAYSGGRKIIVTSGTATVTTTNNNFQHLCLTGSNGQPALSASGTETANLSTVSLVSAGSPILCLADIKTSNSAITAVYDTRTFTTTNKTFDNDITTAAGLGYLEVQSATVGEVTPAAAALAPKLVGVVVASSGSTTAGTVNVVLAIGGPAYVKASAGTVANYVEGTATAGYANTTTSAAASTQNFFRLLGVSQSTFSNTCAANSDNCRTSLFLDISLDQ